MADEWIEFEDDGDWGYAFDEDFGSASALDNILISSDIPKAGGGTLIPGLAIPELSSINFDGSIPRERVSIAAGSVTVGKFVYLDENNGFYTSTEPTDTDISYQIVDRELSGSNFIFSVLKDGVIVQLSSISVSTSIWIVQEAWDDRDNGTSGWVISAEGNSIFNNVAIRGQIEATSGYIGDSEASGWQISSNYIYNSTTKNVFSDYDPSFESYWKTYWRSSTSFILYSSNSATYQLTDTDGEFAGILQCSSLYTGAPYIETKSADASVSYVPFYGSADGSKTFTMSVDIRTYSNINISAEIKCYNSSGTLISGGTFTSTLACTTTVARKSMSNVYPSGTSYISIKFTAPSTTYTPGTAVLSLDALQIEEGSSFTTYEVSSSVYLSTLDEKIKISSSLNAPGRFSVDGLGNLVANTLLLQSTGDVSLDSNAHALQIGGTSGDNLRIDVNEIQAVNNGSATGLFLNRDGGNVTIGKAGASITINGADVTLGNTTQFIAQDIYDSTSGTTANVIVGSAGRLRRISSTQDVKDNIYNLSNNEISGSIDVNKISSAKVFDPYSVLELSSVSFSLINDERDSTVIGFIAEDIADKSPELAEYDDNGKPIYFNIGGIAAAMLVVIQDQQDRINSLEERLAILEG